MAEKTSQRADYLGSILRQMALMAEEVMNRIRTLRTMLKCSPTPEDKQSQLFFLLSSRAAMFAHLDMILPNSERKPSLQQLVCNESEWAGDRGEEDDAISVGTLRAAVEEYASDLPSCLHLICTPITHPGHPGLGRSCLP